MAAGLTTATVLDGGGILRTVAFWSSDGTIGGTLQPVGYIKDGELVSLGAMADAAATTDTGTFSLISLFKRELAKWRAEDVASADGDPGIGMLAVRKATPANTSGADGDFEFPQMSAGRLWTSATIDAALPTGANVVGRVGIDQTTPGTTNLVAASQSGTWNINAITTLPALAAGAAVIGSLAANQSVNVNQIAGVTPTLNSGVVGAGSLRVTLATDVALPAGTNIVGALVANQTVNNAQVAGVAIAAGSGVVTGGTQRMVLATDVALPAGANIVGKVGIDQTTPGTTNLVAAGQNGTWNITNVSGTVSLPTGASTAANQTSIIGSKAPGTAAASSMLAGGVYNSAGVTLTDTQQASLQVDSAGNLKVTGGGGGQQFPEDQAHVSGDLGTMALGVRKDTPASLPGSDGDYTASIYDSTNRLWVHVGAVDGNVAITAAALPLPSGAATDAAITSVTGTKAAGTAATSALLTGGVFNTTPPTITNGQQAALQLTAAGRLNVDVGTVAITANSSVNVAQINGVTPLMGNGASGTGAQRVTIASDSTGQITAIGATTVADALALTNNVKVVAAQMVYNGATLDMARSVVAGLNSTGVGIMSAGVIAQLDDTSPTAVTENQFAVLRMTSRRELYTANNQTVAGTTAVTGTFTGTGQSGTFIPLGGRGFDLSLWGTFVANIQLERRLDATNWLPCTDMGQSVVFSAPCTEVCDEPKALVDYRLNCTAYTSGTVNYRLEQ